MKIFDFHTHPLYDFQGAVTPERFVAEMKAAGVDRFAGSVIHKDDVDRPTEEYEEITRRVNREAREFYRLYPDMYVPGVHIHPSFPELSIAELEKHAAGGFKLVGELVPYLMGWQSYDEDGFFDIMETAQRLDMVVNIHYKRPQSIFAFAEHFPHLTIVVAHLDAHGAYDTHIELMKKHDNILFDISASGTDHEGMIRDAVNKVGCERILFGSDHPGCTPEPFVRAVLTADLTDDEREAIFYKNAERLLGIKE